ncbi:UDP-4-amino-4-deoxy-L-arabinose--oxoglutarate aminotransferase [Brevibacterium casei]|uniref:UDP-4-amino-4-deoxy-L-arabinose--oxoglutarate aminotransferase n=1 Tax=Brevibacterium casei TaxID=33889 RepID=A0A449DAY6_9MICO|nr:DegT/DnrJ/EryC1/StrS family aminotransferase [Brevibacterium casei]VEW14723.1 UDP-4-amino-4-deoxy-L-arabinose--oxoglutarate aminotransferase [Brevibacterium casei]
MSGEFIPPASPIIGDAERRAVDEVLKSGIIAQGPEVSKFESEFALQVADPSTCVAVNSGTSALHLGLLAAGIGAGDEVIVPSFTFAATANSVALTGATPVFADIDIETFTLDPESVQNCITERTRAVMAVHLYGLPADVAKLQVVCDDHGLLFFEDAAQAHLAEFDGQRVGTFGLFGAFSLYPTKNMTSGEGGMVSASNEELLRLVRVYRNQGMERRYENEVIGFNYRMTDVHAAIGRVQLRQLTGWTESRRSNAHVLDTELRGVVTPPVPDGRKHVYHQYTVRIDGASADERNQIAAALKDEHNVGTGVYYPVPNHRLPSLIHFSPNLNLPVTERAAAECLSLPVHPKLDESDLERIVSGVNSVVRAGA